MLQESSEKTAFSERNRFRQVIIFQAVFQILPLKFLSLALLFSKAIQCLLARFRELALLFFFRQDVQNGNGFQQFLFS